MTATRRRVLGTAAGIALATALPRSVRAAPSARLIDERWTRFGGGGDPDHAAWAGFLGRHLRTGTPGGINLVDYAGARADRDALRSYLDGLAGVRPTTLSQGAAMAYWINLYNALTVDLVLEAWPVETIREVRGGLLNSGPWDEEVVRVEGRDLSLDDIEHGILRPVWRDPRIHYGVNCASIGCPNLAAEPYSGSRMDAMLAAGARAYVGHPRGAEALQDGLVVSSIYEWFKEDFGGSDAGVIDHLASHAPKTKSGAIRSASGIADDRYDWSINAA